MLHFITGRTGSGKTAYTHKLIADFVGGESGSAVLIVPEQYTFFCERALLEKLGPARMARAEVLSFTRLAENCLEKAGRAPAVRVDNSAKAVLMSLALEDVGERLDIYAKHTFSPSFIREMLDTVSELKKNGVSASMLGEAAPSLADSTLARKLRDLSLVAGAYEDRLAGSGSDEDSLLPALCSLLLEKPLFDDAVVFIDAFSGFTGQELQVIERLLVQARVVYVTLCTDTLYPLPGDKSIFANIRQTALKLTELANRNNVKIAKPWMLSSGNKYNNFPLTLQRYHVAALAALEAGIFAPSARVFEEETDAVTLTQAQSIQDECDCVAREIKKMLREGAMRSRDITVIARSKQAYEQHLIAAFQKYGIPVFADSRQPVSSQPLIVFVRCAVEIAAEGFRTDTVLRWLKTGLTGIDPDAVSSVENYVLLWNINFSRWLEPWRSNPNGFGSELSAHGRETLDFLNARREEIVRPLVKLKNALSGADGRQAAGAVFDLLSELSVPENLKQLALALEDAGERSLAGEQQRLWDDLMEVLDITAAVIQKPVDAKRFKELLDLMLGARTLGNIPQGLDEVIVGSADRIRTQSPKAVFAVGANEGVFPLSPVSRGMLTDSDRESLSRLGLLSDTGESRVIRERFLAYISLCSASEKLYVSYPSKDASGAALSPSEIILELQRLFPKLRVNSSMPDNPEDMIEAEIPAFEFYAANLRKGQEPYISLRAYFSQQAAFAPKLEALERACDEKPFAIKDRQAAKLLFGKQMTLSASRVENYYRCPFQYFCKYGLKAQPRRKAELDAMQKGTILHFVLETLLKKHAAGIVCLTPEQRITEIKQALADYFERKMVGEADNPNRLAYLYHRLAPVLNEILERLAQEFQNSDFVPVDFELAIGRGDGIPAYRVALDDGSELLLTGSVDRVDTMVKNGKTYIRVIDYKSGQKDFRLSDVLAGINLQMLLYLFAIHIDGRERYGETVPAGILYYYANAPAPNAERGDTPEKMMDEKLKSARMKGLVLNDETVIRGMDRSCSGRFIPVKADGTGSIASLEQLGKLNQKIDALLAGMAARLGEGRIEALPAFSDNETPPCKYCDYTAVCGIDPAVFFKRIERLTNPEALRQLEGEEGGPDEMDEPAAQGD